MIIIGMIIDSFGIFINYGTTYFSWIVHWFIHGFVIYAGFFVAIFMFDDE